MLKKEQTIEKFIAFFGENAVNYGTSDYITMGLRPYDRDDFKSDSGLAEQLARYRAERDGEENVGRVLPAEYCFFTGDGRRNHFTTEWKSTDCFGWTLESPYTD